VMFFKFISGPLIAVIAIGGLIFAGYKYIDNKDRDIASKVTVINQLENNISVLKNQIINQEYQIELIHNLRVKNSVIQKELRKKEIKIIGRDYLKLKSSSHRELVLKIINKSVINQFKIFEEKQP